MKTAGKVVVGVVAVGVAGLAVFAALAWRSEIASVDPPDPSSFPPELVARGAALAAIGNCAVCHTTANGKPLAGGLPVPTPFGTIYSVNITPDPETGIGRWSRDAFDRALREGVDRQGNHLYPAFPYDHFTLIGADDRAALYAFLMTRAPVRAEAPANDLVFPLNFRMLVAGWKILFLRDEAYRENAAQSPEWNRGAYLVEGLAHCSSCHTPRNFLGAEIKSAAYDGADVENWHAYAINAKSPAPVPWTVEAMRAYLRQGWHEHHGISRGPMAPVTANLGSVPEEDVAAMAVYVVSLMGTPSADRVAAGEAALAAAEASGPGEDENAGMPGAALYGGACARCHSGGRPVPFGGLDLTLSTAIQADHPQNIANVVFKGIPPAEGEQSPIMPAFGAALTDRQAADLLAYMRARFSDKPAWTGLEKVAQTARDSATRTYRADGAQNAPPPASAGE